jgi:hypothetical protein
VQQAQDRRIVDRRSERLYENGKYWPMLLKMQWPSLLLLALLGAAFVAHLFKYHLH